MNLPEYPGIPPLLWRPRGLERILIRDGRDPFPFPRGARGHPRHAGGSALIPTGRALALVAGLVLLSSSTLFLPALGALIAGVDLVFVVLVLVDFVRAGSPASLRPRRAVPERVKLSLDFERTLTLAGGVPGRVVTLHEAVPASFEARSVAGGSAGMVLEPGSPDRGCMDENGEVVLTRRYRPHLRGRFALGDLRVRLRGPLGLIERQTRFAGEQVLAVEPALLRLSETLRLAASERWQDLGARSLRRRGGRSEFESLREYVIGDEVRTVDWKAFARRGKPMVRSYRVEHGQELILLVDCGRRMRVTGGGGERAAWTKLDWALDATLELAAAALRQGDRVGVAVFERGLIGYVAPTRGARALPRLSNLLFPLQPSEHDGELAHALRELAVRHRRRATVLVVSDVADPLSLQEQRGALRAASRAHRVIFAALDDPEVRRAAETQGDPVLRAAAGEQMAERARSLRTLASSGARVLDALPAEAAAPMLAAWLDERRAG